LRLIGILLRVYSYIFEAILSLASLALSAVIFGSPHQTVQLGWLPWPNETLGAWLAGLGVLGLLLVILAAAGRLRFLFMLFALGALILIARGFFFSQYHFDGAAEMKKALWLVAGLFLAFLGSISFGSRGSYADSSRR
jgi:hypothetical protein